MSIRTTLAARHLQQGGVISIPTDTIQGLSCLPEDLAAVEKIIALKRRSANKGLILLASDPAYVAPYVANLELLDKLNVEPEPTTYLLKASATAPALLTGGFPTIAIRLTDNALIQNLCEQTHSALVSSSANTSGKDCATSILQLKVFFGNDLDYLIAPKNYNGQASKIINLETGERLR